MSPAAATWGSPTSVARGPVARQAPQYRKPAGSARATCRRAHATVLATPRAGPSHAPVTTRTRGSSSRAAADHGVAECFQRRLGRDIGQRYERGARLIGVPLEDAPGCVHGGM